MMRADLGLPPALASPALVSMALASMLSLASGCAPLSSARDSASSDIVELLTRLPAANSDAPPAPPLPPDTAPELDADELAPEFTLDTMRVPVAVFYRALSSLTGADIVLDSGIDGQVSLRMDGVSWRQVADTAASQLGLYANRYADGRLLRIQTTPCTQPACTRQRVYKLRHADAEILAELLRQTARQQGNALAAVADKSANRLVLSGAASAVDAAWVLAQRLDNRRALVLVEMWILETSDESSRLLGLDLGLGERASQPSVAGGLGDGEFNIFRRDAAGSGAAVIRRLDRQKLSLRLRALEQDGFTRILSNPRIFALDGEAAEVFQGDEVPYTVTTENGASHTEFRQAGLRLEVLPRVMASGDIALRLRISKDTVDQSRASPPISRREMRTQLRLRPGHIAVIGGISAANESGRRSGLGPLMGSGEGLSGSSRLLVVLSATLAAK